jgi:hypothetical protein
MSDASAAYPLVVDNPTLSSSASSPSTDSTDSATKITYIMGGSGVTTPTPSQIAHAAQWVKGGSEGIGVINYGTNWWRFPSSITAYNTAGNIGIAASGNAAGWGLQTLGTTLTFDLYGDCFYLRCTNGTVFNLYVNGVIVSNATLGTGVAANASASGYSVSGGNNYLKVKFTSVANRRIHFQCRDISDIYTKVTHTITPVLSRINWLHFGDSFSEGCWDF